MPHANFAHAAAGGPPLLGGWITLDAMPIVELLAGAGFDYLGIDTQHSMIDLTAAARLMYALPANAPPVLVRVPDKEGMAIGKILDFGADGVIVPMINTAAEAAEVVAACRYHPGGVRSFGPVRLHIGRDLQKLQDRVAIFPMIETAEGLANVAAIARTPGLTGLYVGPADLAVAIGLPPSANPTPPPLTAAMERIAAACADAGIIPGVHGLSAPHIGEVLSQGYRLVSLTADKGYMLAGAAVLLGQCRTMSGAGTRVSNP